MIVLTINVAIDEDKFINTQTYIPINVHNTYGINALKGTDHLINLPDEMYINAVYTK